MDGLNMLASFLGAHWLDLIALVVVVAVLLILWKMGYKKQVLVVIRTAVAQAEQAFGSRTGQIKRAAAISAVYARMPVILRLLIPESEIGALIDAAVDWMNEQLDEQEANLLGVADEVAAAEKPPGEGLGVE